MLMWLGDTTTSSSAIYSKYYNTIPDTTWRSLRSKKEDDMLQATYETPEDRNPKKEIFALYGTLKAHHRNHDLIMQDKARFLHRAVIQDFCLVEVACGVPGVIGCIDNAIYVELWELQEPNISLLKRFEQGYEVGTATVSSGNNPSGTRYASIFMCDPRQPIQKILHNIVEWDISLEKRSLAGRL